MPIRKQPVRLTVSVPQGNAGPKRWTNANPTRYRRTPPSAEPAAITASSRQSSTWRAGILSRAVCDDLDGLERDEAFMDHLIERRDEGANLLFRVDDLNQDRKVG